METRISENLQLSLLLRCYLNFQFLFKFITFVVFLRSTKIDELVELVLLSDWNKRDELFSFRFFKFFFIHSWCTMSSCTSNNRAFTKFPI